MKIVLFIAERSAELDQLDKSLTSPARLCPPGVLDKSADA